MNILGALDYPTAGDVLFQGKNISKASERERDDVRRYKLGYVFQSFGLLPLMSAYENVEFGLRIAGVPKDQRKKMAREALAVVGLSKRMDHRPLELSGGEQQRVSIARAIAHRPAAVLADEPTAELDSRMGLQVLKLFRNLVDNEGLTVVIATHDPAIMEVADVVYTLEDGQIV
jgi:ABC transporter.